MAVGALVAILVLGGLVLLLTGDDDAESVSGTPGSGDTPAATPSVDASGSPLPSRDPDQPGPVETVEPQRQERIRVPLQEPAVLGNGVRVALTRIESVKGEARGPGETAGPALRITVAVTNDSAEEVALLGAVLTAFYGPDAAPAGDLSGPGRRILPQSVAPGRTVRGTYVFAVPVDQRDRLRVEFGYDAEEPRVVFVGAAPAR